jgi:Holliday junction resolvasome RuvABC endonuclease subunit
MNILGIDPGNIQTGWLLLQIKKEGIQILDKGKTENYELKKRIPELLKVTDSVAMETVASMGMAVGQSVFDTCIWIGRFVELLSLHNVTPTLYKRKEICLHICDSVRAKDTNIRTAMIDRYGEVGTKKNPGVLYGVSKDMWSALAIATTHADKMGF